MTTDSMRHKVRELFLGEMDLSASFYVDEPILDNDGKPNFAKLLHASRKIFKFSKNRTDDPDIKSWGHWAQLPLPVIIAIQGQVIVDLHPIQEEDFPAIYGVSLQQFKRLCQERIILLNIYEDGAIQDEIKEEKKLEKSNYLRFPELEPLFDQDEFGTRVLGVRRARLLQFAGLSPEAQRNYAEKYKNIILPKLSERPAAEWNKILTGTTSDTLDGIATKISNNLVYVHLLGSEFDHQKLFRIETIERNYAEIENIWPFLDMVQWARGRKTDLSSPITAAYGGTYNNQDDEDVLMRSYLPPSDLDRQGQNRKVLSPEMKALAEFQARASEIRKHGPWNINEAPIEMWKHDQKFENFLSFIKEKRDILCDIDEQIWRSNALWGGEIRDVNFQEWTTYLEKIRDIYRDSSPQTGTRQVLDGMVATAAAGGAVAGTAYVYNQYLRSSISVSIDQDKRNTLALLLGFLAVPATESVAAGLQTAVGGFLSDLEWDENADAERSARRVVARRMQNIADIPMPDYLNAR